MPIEKIEVSAVGLLVMDEKLLCVSNDNEYWYLPGGRLDPGEDMKSCLVREFKEETGLDIECLDLKASMELIDHDFGKHKVTLIFSVKLLNGTLENDWQDCGNVKFRKAFSFEEIAANEKFVPRRIMANPFWKDLRATADPIYQGFEPFTIKD